MDIEAKPIGNDIWHLMDLLGSLVQTSLGFLIEHDDAGILVGIERGPHLTLLTATAAVGRKVVLKSVTLVASRPSPVEGAASD